MTGDKLVNADTGEVIAEMTPDEARDVTNRMRTAAGVLTELYVDAYTRRAWAALGHASWDAYLAAEFGDFHLRLPREERDDVIGSLRAAGLSIRAIAATGVASKKTVERTIAASGVANDDTCITGTDGKTYATAGLAKAAERKAQEAQADTGPEPQLCSVDGCPTSTVAADGLCFFHRTKAAEPNQPPAAGSAPDPDLDGSAAVEGQQVDIGGSGHPASQPPDVGPPSPEVILAARRAEIAAEMVKARALLERDPASVVASMSVEDTEVWCSHVDDMAEWAHQFEKAMKDRNHLRSAP